MMRRPVHFIRRQNFEAKNRSIAPFAFTSSRVHAQPTLSVKAGLCSWFHMILYPASGSFGSMTGNGAPPTKFDSSLPSAVRRTWAAYFSVASLYTFGHSYFW
jgi:hypothetical protein